MKIHRCLTSRFPGRRGPSNRHMMRVGAPRSRLIGRRPKFATARTGTAAVEFALVAPVLLMLVLGMCQFGITLNQYLTLTNAVRSGARVLSVSRGSATPFTDTTNQIYGSAPNLTQGSLTITMAVNGTACSTDAGCNTALLAAGAAGAPAAVTASYPCSLAFFGYNFAPICTLSSKTTERVE
jgi:Flp pilus assembly protein TadG